MRMRFLAWLFLPACMVVTINAHAFGDAIGAALQRAKDESQRTAAALQACQTTPSTDIWQATRCGDTTTLQRMVDQGVSVNAVNDRGETPLGLALKHRVQTSTQWLLAHGANPNQLSNDYAPLKWAYWAGLPKKDGDVYDGRWLQWLLQAGGDVHMQTRYSIPLLGDIARDEPPHVEALRVVLAHQPNVNQVYLKDCTTALMSAQTNSSQEPNDRLAISRLLLEAGANPNLMAKGIHAPTALLLASSFFSSDYPPDDPINEPKDAFRQAQLQVLLDHGANPRLGWRRDGAKNGAATVCPRSPNDRPDRDSVLDIQWIYFPDTMANAALTQLLSDVSSQRGAFDAVLRAAAPIVRGEVGFQALYNALYRFNFNLDYVNSAHSAVAEGQPPRHANDAPAAERLRVVQQRQQTLADNIASLVALGAQVNPPVLTWQHDEPWQNLWISPVEHLPLYADALPDPVYRALLEAGASPAIRPDNGWTTRTSVLVHLVNQRAASKLTLLSQHLGLLQRIPTWCGVSAHDLAQALVHLKKQVDSSANHVTNRTALAAPNATLAAAKPILLTLLQTPGCTASADKRQSLQRAVAQLDDADIAAAWRGSWVAKNSP